MEGMHAQALFQGIETIDGMEGEDTLSTEDLVCWEFLKLELQTNCK